MIWRDISSWSRDTPSHLRIPQTWETTAGFLRIVVTRLHGAAPSTWFMLADGLTDTRELEAKEIGAAKEEAIAWVTEAVRRTLGDLAK